MPRHHAYRATIVDNPDAIELPTQLHPLVAAWIERDRVAEEEARAQNRTIWPKREDTYMGRRKLRINDALFKAAEAKGYVLECPAGEAQPVSLIIKGRHARWSLEKQSGAYVPRTFKLIVSVESTTKKTQMTERLDWPFERRIDQALRRIEKLVDDTIAYEIRSAEIERESAEEVRAIERPRRLKAMENARWECLREQATEWQEAKLLRAFINAVEHKLGDAPRSGRDTSWLEWARNSADWLDPLSKGAASARRITRWRYDPDRSEYELSVWELD